MSWNVRRIVAVHSCKGGVGKSTVSAGLALTLASQGYSVGICDLDICGPSIAKILGVDCSAIRWKEVIPPPKEERHKTLSYDEELCPHCHQNDVEYRESDDNSTVHSKNCQDPSHSKAQKPSVIHLLEPKVLKGIEIMSPEFILSRGNSGYAAYRGPILGQISRELITKTAWGNLDYLILDLPPGTSDTIIGLLENIDISGAIAVTTPHKLSYHSVSKGIRLFGEASIPVVSIVENMSYFECECSKRHYIFGESGIESICAELSIDNFVPLPIMPPCSEKTEDKAENPENLDPAAKPSIFDMAMIRDYYNREQVQEMFHNLAKAVLRHPATFLMDGKIPSRFTIPNLTHSNQNSKCSSSDATEMHQYLLNDIDW